MFAKQLHDDELMAAADQIDRGLPYNVTMDLNCRIYALMNLLDPAGLESVESLAAKIESRSLPHPFMVAWDEFIRLYGFRGPREIDIRTPRYQDDPSLVIYQMINYRSLSEDQSPAAILARQINAREHAYHLLKSKIPHSKKLNHLYDVLVNLGGYREIHKYYLVYAGHKIRKRAVRIAQQWLAAGRIDALNDIFCLKPCDVQQALDDPQIDVRKRVASYRAYMQRVENIESFPPIIDSRGKIIRPERKAPSENELAGDPISAGVAKGPVVIVNFVGEKEVKPGDILVAKAADPGWTPLFINAGGVLLEVGGMLQHGSLIAREYGKPCIAGIEKLTERLQDGQIVEIDGGAGIVKL